MEAPSQEKKETTELHVINVSFLIYRFHLVDAHTKSSVFNMQPAFHYFFISPSCNYLTCRERIELTNHTHSIFLEFLCNVIKSIVWAYFLKLCIHLHIQGPVLCLIFLTPHHVFKICLCCDTLIKFIASKCCTVLQGAQPPQFTC